MVLSPHFVLRRGCVKRLDLLSGLSLVPLRCRIRLTHQPPAIRCPGRKSTTASFGRPAWRRHTKSIPSRAPSSWTAIPASSLQRALRPGDATWPPPLRKPWRRRRRIKRWRSFRRQHGNISATCHALWFPARLRPPPHGRVAQDPGARTAESASLHSSWILSVSAGIGFSRTWLSALLSTWATRPHVGGYGPLGVFQRAGYFRPISSSKSSACLRSSVSAWGTSSGSSVRRAASGFRFLNCACASENR